MSEPVDAKLIAELFDRYAAALELYAAQRTSSPQDSVQEAFIQLAQQPERPHDSVAWLFRVVRNHALNACRAEYRRVTHEAAAARRERKASDSHDLTELRDLLEQLPEDLREIVVLRIWGHLSWQEIAELTGGSRSATHRRYADALRQLRHALEPMECPKLKDTKTK